jgi:hypothetical protein
MNKIAFPIKKTCNNISSTIAFRCKIEQQWLFVTRIIFATTWNNVCSNNRITWRHMATKLLTMMIINSLITQVCYIPPYSYIIQIRNSCMQTKCNRNWLVQKALTNCNSFQNITCVFLEINSDNSRILKKILLNYHKSTQRNQ